MPWMRCFATGDGDVLVEWKTFETGVLEPDRAPLGRAGTFVLLDAAGELVRTWTTTSTSVQEHLSTTAYAIEGDALVGYFHDAAWLHEHEPSLSRSVELDGLRALVPAEAPPPAVVEAAIARHDAARSRARERYDRAERERLSGFERALPELAPGERIALVWRYARSDVVVARATGEEVWREPDWPWMGKDLYRRLLRVAERKYGERLDAFAVDVPPEEYLRFDND